MPRDVLRRSVGAMGPAFWRSALSSEPVTRAAAGPYGPLGAANAQGVAVPAGFSVRLLGQAGHAGARTRGISWPTFPDGSAIFALPDGGLVLAVNSEVPAGLGGASAVRFDRDGDDRRARTGSSAARRRTARAAARRGARGCRARRSTTGQVWECDPLGATSGRRAARARALQARGGGRRPGRQARLPDRGPRRRRALPLHAGRLPRPVARRAGDRDRRRRRAHRLGAPCPTRARRRGRRASRCPARMKFERGEGIFYDTGIVYVATTERRQDPRLRHASARSSRSSTTASAADGRAAAPRRQRHRAPAVGRPVRLRGRRRPADLPDHRRARGRAVRAAVRAPARARGRRELRDDRRDVRSVGAPPVLLVAARRPAGDDVHGVGAVSHARSAAPADACRRVRVRACACAPSPPRGWRRCGARA